MQTPTLVTYIPSLAKGAPFSISIHSWTKPAFSIGAAPLTPGGVETVAWAIRVISDGVCVAYVSEMVSSWSLHVHTLHSSSSFTANTTWPQTIGKSPTPYCLMMADRHSFFFSSVSSVTKLLTFSHPTNVHSHRCSGQDKAFGISTISQVRPQPTRMEYQ